MALKFTGSFGPITGAMKVGDYVAPTTSPTITPTTWDSTEKHGSFTLSNNDLTATHSGNQGGVVSVASASSGKYYWEYTYASSTYATLPGILEETANASVYSTTGRHVVNGYNGHALNGSTDSGSYLPGSIDGTGIIRAGSIIGVALDLDNGWVYISINGVYGDGASLADIEAGAGANALNTSQLPAVAFNAYMGDGSSSNNFVVTANFGGSAFNYTVPTGFTAGFGDPALNTLNTEAGEVMLTEASEEILLDEV